MKTKHTLLRCSAPNFYAVTRMCVVPYSDHTLRSSLRSVKVTDNLANFFWLNDIASLLLYVDRHFSAIFSFCIRFLGMIDTFMPISMAEPSKAKKCGRLRVRIPPAAWMFVCCQCCVCCQVEVSATGRSHVQRSLTDCGCVTVCDVEILRKWRPWLDMGCCARGKNIHTFI
jgi:hypothetical protein